ncbi:hypothetical protein LNN35_09090 [Pseudomonas stutzeri]|jgi:hypothetical protein|uniref:hypothetical protein n=1 Tax=Stutzerimonas stutzeri TaxID=316 RepID=UPI0012D4A5DB|nr:hypothetical protein [Stutzerimonas stutzeri]MCJ0876809.1 hypothetical protein [Pseudomonas sp. JI-2]MCC8342941.1 hypothetical protein [Stutzerimonas stutzeri]MDH1669295.1 hypothetical protein [Stutzerimonas stutzeri]MDI9727828.1 hypothetical protein [Stutzerimonas stutzeri]MDI9730629.1 hypothetical protein [Stutzerimonas stutzeri]
MCIVVVLLRDHDRCCGGPRTDVLFTRPLLWRTGLERMEQAGRPENELPGAAFCKS